MNRLSLWLSSTANLILGFSMLGIVFTLAFWMVTGRVEPTFVALFGTSLTAAGLKSASEESKSVPPPDPPDADPPIRSGRK